MVKRLNLNSRSGARRSEWADEPAEFRGPELFEGRTRYRKMTVVVDAELLAEFTNPPTPSGLLGEMVTSRFINLWRYSDDGPPTDPPLDHGVYSDGWANVLEHTDDTWVVAHARGTTRGHSAVSTNYTRYAGQDTASGV